MADYSKKKNDELMALCKDRGLPHTGKKAELVKRLEDDDAKSGSKIPVAPADEIDWDDEPGNSEATSAQAANATTAGSVADVPNQAAAAKQQPVEDPSTTDDVAITKVPGMESSASKGEEVKDEKDYSSGLRECTIEQEIEKRKARARKFGLPEDSEEIKILERAKRFGTTNLSAVPGLLNSALPGGRDRKRGRDGESDGGIRKRSKARGKADAGRRQGSEKPPTNGSAAPPTWMTDRDREAAEKRRERFAAA